MSIFGKTVNSVLGQARSVLGTVGSAALHSLAPDNFEYYLCSLELLDSSGNSKGFLSFVIMPDSYLENRTQIASITKTQSGITTMFNSTFVPRDISMQGSFGRKLKLLTGMKAVEAEKNDWKTVPFFNGQFGKVAGQEIMIKTGYGLIKMLQNMIDLGYKLDKNQRPHIFIFNNYSLNTNYVVEILQDSYSQSLENNMIWFYSLEMKAIAPASVVQNGAQNQTNFINNVSYQALAGGITGLLSSVTRAINL